MKITDAVYEDGLLRPTQPLSIAEHSRVRVEIKEDTDTPHPHIVRLKNIHGGRPIVRGTRIPVKTVVRYYQMGMQVPEILAGFPDLTTAQLYDALSYYYDNQAEMEADMSADEQSAVQNKFDLTIDADGRLTPS